MHRKVRLLGPFESKVPVRVAHFGIGERKMFLSKFKEVI